jgi:hypothetical protein
MKRKLSAAWNFLKTRNNPIWLTLLLALITIISVVLTSYLARSEEISHERNIAFQEYMLTTSEYAHQLFVVGNSVAEFRQDFENLHLAILDGATPDTVKRLGEIATRSQENFIEQYAQLGSLSLKCDIATGRFAKVTKDPNLSAAIGIIPQVSPGRINFPAVIEKYQGATPEVRLQMANETKESGKKILEDLKELESVFQDGYEKMYSFLMRSIKQN